MLIDDGKSYFGTPIRRPNVTADSYNVLAAIFWNGHRAEHRSYDWDEFCERLITEISSTDEHGGTSTYYECFLKAFEGLMLDKGICRSDEIDRRATGGRVWFYRRARAEDCSARGAGDRGAPFRR